MVREMVRSPRGFEPIGEMPRTQADLNRLFGLRFYPRPEFPMMNLWTGPDGAILAAQVPGVSPDELEITIRGDTITLRGNRPPEVSKEGAVVQRQERMHGPFERSVVLPFRVDADKASAKFDRGVVTLNLPRPESDKPRRIQVARS